MTKQLKRYAYELADKHLRELPDEELVKAAPAHYGEEVSDSHRVFMWSGLVEHYLELDAMELVSKYNRHIRGDEPILKAIAIDKLDPEIQAVIDSIVDLLWNSKQ